MNLNTSIQHEGIVAWSGTAARPIDIRHHVNFSFTFEVTADLAADNVFDVESAPPDTADPCVAGAFVPVPLVPRCDEHGLTGVSTITLPAGTLKGSICKATIPCRPDAFVQVLGKTGGIASVLAVAVLSGPK
jgi:hypothetical protein